MPARAAFACLWLSVAALAQATPPHVPAPGLQRFTSRGLLFAIDLPSGWRQATPSETRQLRAVLPPDAQRTQPEAYYLVGPVDAWLAGGFDGRCLQVVVQDAEWNTQDQDLPGRLQAMWQQIGDQVGARQEIQDLTRTETGMAKYPAIACVRTCTPADGSQPLRSLDLHIPSGGRQINLSFRCRTAEFPARLPEFQAWLQTLQLPQRARGEATLGDRLWTPLLTGAAVGLGLLLLYRHRRRRQAAFEPQRPGP